MKKLHKWLAILLVFGLIAGLMPAAVMADPGENVPVIGASWHESRPDAGWDYWNHNEYRCEVTFHCEINGEEGPSLTLENYSYNSYDASEFVDENGPGTYWFEVWKYDTDNNIAGYGQSERCFFHRVTFSIVTLDVDGCTVIAPVTNGYGDIENAGGDYMFGINGHATRYRKNKNFYYTDGRAELSVTPYTGYLLSGYTINGENLTDMNYKFDLSDDTDIVITFCKNDTRIPLTVEVGSGHEGVAQALCEMLNEQDPANEATVNGTTVTYQTLLAQIIGNQTDVIDDWIYEERFEEKGQVCVGVGLQETYSGGDWQYGSAAIQEKGKPLTEGTTLYIIWYEVITQLDIVVEDLICGTEVEMDYDTYIQTNAPEVISVTPDAAEVRALLYDGSNESDDDEPYPGGEEGFSPIGPMLMPYSGTIMGGQDYNISVAFMSKFGYTADPDNLTVTINGKPTERSGMYNYQAAFTAKHNYVDGVCTGCGEEKAEPKFMTKSLLLSGEIGVNFFMDLSVLTEDEKADSYMEFTVNGKTQKVDIDENFRDNTTGEYYGFTCYVNAIQMADTIEAEFHYGTDETVSSEYSVAEYVTDFDEKISEFDDKIVTLVHAMADYGHYAQIFLAVNNNWTIGVEHAEMAGCYTTSYDEEAIGSALQAYAAVKDLGSSSVTKTSCKLVLDSATTLDVFFTPASGTKLTATASLGGSTYKAAKQKDGRYRVRITNIPAHLLGEAINVSGNAGGSFTVSVSALSYADAFVNNDSTSANGKNAMMALYEYYKAADAVF